MSKKKFDTANDIGVPLNELVIAEAIASIETAFAKVKFPKVYKGKWLETSG